MKRTFKNIQMSVVLAAAITSLVGCAEGRRGDNPGEEAADTLVGVSAPDSALYGTIGPATTMHVLELLTEDGRTLTIGMGGETPADVQGGIFTGDRVTLTTTLGSDDMPQVEKLVNVTSLLGKWTSLDRNFEIKEDGEVESDVKVETNPYTHWALSNAMLILGADTFSILQLGADSLQIENEKGIFVYKRQ